MKNKILVLLLSAAALLAVWKIAAADGGALSSGTHHAFKPLTIAIAADPHYLSPSLTDNGALFHSVIENADGKVTDCSEELLEAFTSQIIEQSRTR